MKFTVDNTNKQYLFELDENDLADANAIRFLMNRNNCPNCNEVLPDSWKVLQKYWQAGRDAILVSGMDGISNKDKNELSGIKWAILRGFVECGAIPERILVRADEYLNTKNTEQGEQGNDELRIEP